MLQLNSLDIVIIGQTSHLEKELKEQVISDEIAVSFKTLPSFYDWDIKAADILIIDGFFDGMDTLVTSAYSQIDQWILCVTAEQADRFFNLPSSFQDAFSSIWLKPCSDKHLTFLYKQLLNESLVKRKQEVCEIFLDTLLDSIPDLVWFKDTRGSHLKVNDAFSRAVGKTKEQCEGRGHYYIWDIEPDEYTSGEYVCLETEDEVLRQGKLCLFDEKVLSKSGLRQFKTYKAPLSNKHGEIFGTVGIGTDVTDLQNASRELEVILSGMPFAAMIADERDCVVYLNDAFTDYFGTSKERLLQMSYSRICEEVLGVSKKELEENNPLEISNEHYKGFRSFRFHQQSIHDIFGNHFGNFLFCLDVTMEYELQQEILHTANTDFLTGLYNRRYFYEAVVAHNKTTPVSLVYFDLDNFKMVNDRYGHQAGDHALVTMAKLLTESFPSDLIARLGGDEFIVARFNECATESFCAEISAFIDKTKAVFSANTKFDFVTVSAGIACGEEHNLDVDILISHADKALCSAKALGKCQYAVYEE